MSRKTVATLGTLGTLDTGFGKGQWGETCPVSQWEAIMLETIAVIMALVITILAVVVRGLVRLDRN
jgi:hypothetical protein